MKRLVSLYFCLLTLALSACGGDAAELERLKNENLDLKAQLQKLNALQSEKKVRYILKIRLKQANFTLSIKKHIKNAVNAIDFELPVDKDFYDSVSKGTEIVDIFRFGSFVLYGSFGDWEMTVKDKEIREM